MKRDDFDRTVTDMITEAVMSGNASEIAADELTEQFHQWLDDNWIDDPPEETDNKR